MTALGPGGTPGTALSAALGMAVARDMSGGSRKIVALCGDAAFTNGISFEALNNIATTKQMLVILNDNEWSIDKNVGAIAEYFHKIATNPTYVSLHDRATGLLQKIGGKAAVHIAKKAEEAAKGIVGRGMIFEEFGLEYYGPVDGHNLQALIETFKFLKKQNKPVVLQALTQKGRGFAPWRWSSRRSFMDWVRSIRRPERRKPAAQKTYSEIFAESLTKLADTNDKVVAITAAMPNGTALDLFRPHHPTRYFDVGIAEEHAVLFAAGMATKGYRPFCAIYSTFLQRAFDQIVHDVALQELPVVFCMDRGEAGDGDDGPDASWAVRHQLSARGTEFDPHGSDG